MTVSGFFALSRKKQYLHLFSKFPFTNQVPRQVRGDTKKLCGFSNEREGSEGRASRSGCECLPDAVKKTPAGVGGVA